MLPIDPLRRMRELFAATFAAKELAYIAPSANNTAPGRPAAPPAWTLDPLAGAMGSTSLTPASTPTG